MDCQKPKSILFDFHLRTPTQSIESISDGGESGVGPIAGSAAVGRDDLEMIGGVGGQTGNARVKRFRRIHACLGRSIAVVGICSPLEIDGTACPVGIDRAI